MDDIFPTPMFDFQMRCLNKYICLARTRHLHGFPYISFRVIWIRHTIQVNVNYCLTMLPLTAMLYEWLIS